MLKQINLNHTPGVVTQLLGLSRVAISCLSKYVQLDKYQIKFNFSG